MLVSPNVHCRNPALMAHTISFNLSLLLFLYMLFSILRYATVASSRCVSLAKLFGRSDRDHGYTGTHHIVLSVTHLKNFPSFLCGGKNNLLEDVCIPTSCWFVSDSSAWVLHGGLAVFHKTLRYVAQLNMITVVCPFYGENWLQNISILHDERQLWDRCGSVVLVYG